MCYFNKYQCDCHSQDYPDFCCDRPIVPKQCITDISTYIRKWYPGNLESCNDQYSNGWNEDLYFYSRSRAVYDHYNDADNNDCADHTYFYSHW